MGGAVKAVGHGSDATGAVENSGVLCVQLGMGRVVGLGVGGGPVGIPLQSIDLVARKPMLLGEVLEEGRLAAAGVSDKGDAHMGLVR